MCNTSSMTGSVREESINTILAQLLRRLDLDATAEESVSSGRMDVVVRFSNYVIGIECEKTGAGKKKSAIDDALKRIQPDDADAVAVFAVVYPKGCTDTNLRISTQIEYAIIRSKDTDKSANALRKSKKWEQATVQELARAIRYIEQDLGNPDEVAGQLRRVLDFAAMQLSDQQKKSISNALSILAPSDNWQIPATRALLVVASASMFHARLDEHLSEMRPEVDARTRQPFAGIWPPLTIGQCLDQSDPVQSLSDSWDLILAVDYKPIFQTAREVLKSATGMQFTNAIVRVTKEGRSIAQRIEGLRHDLLGRIFHAVLDTARNDGSYYTTTAAATLAASLALTNTSDLPEDLKDFVITDPACGTGTLLMAMAERIRELRKDDVDYADLIEHVLTGYDINLTATHMAATTLGLLSPITKFDEMNIYQAKFGPVENGEIAIGSLELYKGMRLRVSEWPGEKRATQIDSLETQLSTNKADIVIMNPPFTRDSLRHNQFAPK